MAARDDISRYNGYGPHAGDVRPKERSGSGIRRETDQCVAGAAELEMSGLWIDVKLLAMARDAISMALATTKHPIMLARVKRQALSSARFAALRSI